MAPTHNPRPASRHYHSQPRARGSQQAPESNPPDTAQCFLSWVIKIFVNDPNPDQLQRLLQPDPSKKYFLRDYRKLKTSPGKTIVESLVNLYVFHAPPAGSSESTSGEGIGTDHGDQSNITFSHALNELCLKTSGGFETVAADMVLKAESVFYVPADSFVLHIVCYH